MEERIESVPAETSGRLELATNIQLLEVGYDHPAVMAADDLSVATIRVHELTVIGGA
jgi:hypothetical protein